MIRVASILADDDRLHDRGLVLDGLFGRRQEGIERLRLQLPHAPNGVQVRHLALGQHFLFDMQDRGVDLIGDQRRHVFACDADEVDVLGIDLGRAQYAAAQNVGKTAGLLDADALALQDLPSS